ncbi:DUF1990 family protein [Hymenobacter sp. BT491]|uniref:DUF1990 family protein n=1 Tax=Hymenobacter sp. BT491 TaxID=2766779 RepID=UPI001653AD6F|nr:DUF1990 family protein [Hymenobacter sp. BT491]MBC6988105.1 DUF1990 family protein [Hymenobacter sp. BT491]
MAKPEQPAHEGSGALFERRYYVDIEHPTQSADALIEAIKCDVEHFSPDLLADFKKVKGEAHLIKEGDEFSIKILGPWNGLVRVDKVENMGFEFVTLEGHPEAGRIRFSLRHLPNQPDTLRFEIHSWARSRDGLVSFAYDTLGIGRRVQEKTWCTFCERVAEASGGKVLAPVHIETIDHDHDTVEKKHG